MNRLARYAFLAFLPLTLAALGCDSGTTTPASKADVTITIVAMDGVNSFSPNPANVAVGQTVAWHNAQGTTHTATQDGGGFDTGNIANGATSTPIPISTAGDLAYHCSIHPTMVGTLHVSPAHLP
jgi:plastocyanin